jgi:hypothetical protein
MDAIRQNPIREPTAPLVMRNSVAAHADQLNRISGFSGERRAR